MTKNKYQESLNWLVACIQNEVRSADSIKKLFVTETAWEHRDKIQELINMVDAIHEKMKELGLIKPTEVLEEYKDHLEDLKFTHGDLCE